MVRYSHATEKSGEPGKSEQRNDFEFGSMQVVGDSGKNSLNGVMGMGAQLRRTCGEEVETETWATPAKSFHRKERKAESGYI